MAATAPTSTIIAARGKTDGRDLELPGHERPHKPGDAELTDVPPLSSNLATTAASTKIHRAGTNRTR